MASPQKLHDRNLRKANPWTFMSTHAYADCYSG